MSNQDDVVQLARLETLMAARVVADAFFKSEVLPLLANLPAPVRDGLLKLREAVKRQDNAERVLLGFPLTPVVE